MKKFQRINENTFKLMEVNEYSAEELEQIWQEDKAGEYIQINDNGTAFYVAHGRAMEQIQPQYGNLWAGIRAWMKAKNFSPNIWSVNDHGNVTLHSQTGKSLGGLV